MVRPFILLKNLIRNALRGSLLGALIRDSLGKPTIERLMVVAATRDKKEKFWQKSALGISLSKWLEHPLIRLQISYENVEGLSVVYNRQIQTAKAKDILLFVHDDVWLDDPQWIEKLVIAVERYDIVGVAGNTRISRDQPSWLTKEVSADRFEWDYPHLSGSISHGNPNDRKPVFFGVSPAVCQLLDGVFLAARANVLKKSNVRFDEQFKFHFYDLDFCRSARHAGLLLGTWPIELTHQSEGSFLSPLWNEGLRLYRKKWKH